MSASRRLLLTPRIAAHNEEIFRAFTPEVTRYMFPRPPERIEETVAFGQQAEQKLRAGTDLQVVILDKQMQEFFGCGGLHDLKTRHPELGVWIKKSAHGHKYGREAMAALKAWADEHIDYEYIKYPVDKENIASRKIAESLGGVVAEEYDTKNMSGNILHEVEYRIPKGKKE